MSSPALPRQPSPLTEEDGWEDNDPPQDSDAGEGDVMCVSTDSNQASSQQECISNTTTSVLRSSTKRNVTFRDFTDVANSVANLALSLPKEDSRMECLGILVCMRDALSLSASGHQASVPLMGFMSSAEEFLGAFGTNADSRREGVFADHGNSNFEMQRHNIGKVRQRRLTSMNERNALGRKRRRPLLTEVSQNLHLTDARVRPAQCSYCGSCQHTIKRCSVMDKVAFVGKKNSAPWNQWYRTLGNPSHHDVVLPTAGCALLMNRELQQDIPPPSQIICHLSVKAVFYSSEAVEFMSRPTSKYRSNTNMQIPSPDNNIVELQLIERGGNLVIRQYDTASRIEREVTTTFYTRAKAVQKWMEKASSNSHLFVYVKAKET